MNIIVITQARVGSTRLPNKVLKEILGKSLLQIHIDRIKQSKLVNDIFIATTTNKDDDKIEELAKQLSVKYYRGSENDVLDRYYQTIKNIKPDYIIRLTSDCPLIDGKLVDEMIKEALKKKLDYFSNTIEETYPDGQDIEIFTFKALKKAWTEAVLKSDREHVTPYIKNNSTYNKIELFTSDNYRSKKNYNDVRLTVDEFQDFEAIKQIVEDLGLNEDWKTYADYYLKTHKIKTLNCKIVRNEGYQKSIKKD